MQRDPEYAAQRRAYHRLYNKRRSLKDPHYRENLPSFKKQASAARMRRHVKKTMQKRRERKQAAEALKKFKANPL
jgi:hypothetical protein